MEISEAQKLREQVAAFLDPSENPVARDIAQNMVLQFLRDHLVSGGTLYLVDGAPMLLLPDGRLELLTLENQRVRDYLHAAGLPLSGYWKQMAGDTLTTGGLEERRLHGGSYYVEASHELFVNTWNWHHLRFDGTGAVTERLNGEGGLLFVGGSQPHVTDLAAVNHQNSGDRRAARRRALAWSDSDPLIEHILGVGVFSDTTGLQAPSRHQHFAGLAAGGRNAGRGKSVPVPFLSGPSGSKKTAIAQAVGQLLTPEGEAFRVTSCPSGAKDVENVIINSHFIVALDEFQHPKDLSSTLKALVTGAWIRRRILFTTSQERVYYPDAVPFLTVNADLWFDEALQKRLLRVSMGQPSMETGGWRGEVFIARDWREKKIREKCWNELVGRLAACMFYLQQAKERGRDDLRGQPSDERIFFVSVVHRGTGRARGPGGYAGQHEGVGRYPEPGG